MAGFGAKRPIFAPMATEPDTSAPTYSTGLVIGKLVSANLTVTMASGELWADNYKAESEERFASGSLALETDSLTDAVAEEIFGCTVSDGLATYNSNDVIPYGGLGYYKVLKRAGVVYYKGYWYPKAKATISNDSASTTNASITFSTETVTFTIDEPKYGGWMQTKTFTGSGAEASCIAWLNSKAGITSSED